MSEFVEPGKQTVRAWLAGRRTATSPPPPIQQIRVELGWSAGAGKEASDARRRANRAE